MELFSFLKKEKQLKFGWCGREMEEALYTNYIGHKNLIFALIPANKVLENQAK